MAGSMPKAGRSKLDAGSGSWKPVARSWKLMSFIEVTGVTKTYPVGGARLTVLKGLDLTLERGEMVAIVGASGVGKSTLLHVMGGLDAVDEGRVRIGDTELNTLGDAGLVAFRNQHVGFVFQFHHLLPE